MNNSGFCRHAKFLMACVAVVGFCSSTAAAAEKVYRNVYSEPKKMILDDGAPAAAENYFGVGFSWTFAGFEQRHLMDGVQDGSEKYLTAVPSLGLLLGTGMEKDWRGEIEAGFISKYSKTDADNVEFSIRTYYILAGGAWDFYRGFYLGGGFGLAASDIKINDKSGSLLSPASVANTGVSPMLALRFGYRIPFAEKWTADFSYRFAGFWGAEQTLVMKGTGSDYTSDIGFIASHQIGAGITRKF
ncbi:MAG: outer membrane beta-barrel protein [Rickettsiales bacterium]|nr:outer membrane beta-barrel protein [Rickettsiales bacterium]